MNGQSTMVKGAVIFEYQYATRTEHIAEQVSVYWDERLKSQLPICYGLSLTRLRYELYSTLKQNDTLTIVLQQWSSMCEALQGPELWFNCMGLQ